MKRLSKFSLAAILVLTTCSLANAASVGGDISKKGQVSIGFENTFSTLRCVEEIMGDSKDEGKVESIQYFIKASYGVLDWLEVNGKVGIANMEYKDALERFGFDEVFAWCVGSKLRLYENKRYEFKVLLQAQWLAVYNLTVKDKYMVSGDTLEFDWDEWQVSVGINKRFGIFKPYVGVIYSELELKGSRYDVGEDTTNKVTLKGRCSDGGGVFVGTDINFTDRVCANAEARFWNRLAFTVGLSYKF